MRIMLCYDGSEIASRALIVAKSHAVSMDAKVDVVLALQRKSASKKKVKQAEEVLSVAREIFSKDDIPCKTHLLVRELSHGEMLVEFCKENHIHQIVMGVKRRSLMSKLILGSTSQYVIVESPCPVLAVK